MSEKPRVLITGGNGYMARNLKRLFKASERYFCYAPTREQVDLLNFSVLKDYVELINPQFVIHAAVKGGTVLDKDTLQDTADNIRMYDNLASCVSENTTIVIIGSGSEFDRSQDIDCAVEEDVIRSYPIDPYGLAKNIITRKSLEDTNSMIFRLFGCFCADEDNYRFIKSCILSIKKNKPIVIKQDKMMDFFYMDDVFTVMDFFFEREPYSCMSGPHINLVYYEKSSLLNIASMVSAAAGKKNYPIEINEMGMGKSYTGDGTYLNRLVTRSYKNVINLVGLEEGIARTVKALL